MQIKKSCRRSWLRRLRPSAARLPRTLHLFRGHTSEEEGPVQCGRGRGPKTRRWGRGRAGEQPGCFPRPPAKCLACRGRPSAASGARAQPGWRLPSDESAKAEPHGDQRGPGDRRLLSAGRAEGTAPPPSFWNQFFVTSAVLGASARHPASQQHPDLSLRTFLIRGTCFQRLKSTSVNRPWPSNAIELDYLKWFETQTRAAAAVHSIQHTSISPISTLPFKLLGEKRKVPFQLSHIQNLKNVLLWKRIFCQKITLLLGFLGSG